MPVRKIKGSWWADFRHDHTRYRRRSPDNSRAGAQAYEAVLRRKLARGESVDRKEFEPKPTFKQFANTWLQDYVAINSKPRGYRTKVYLLNAKIIPFFGSMQIDKIETRDIEEFKKRLLSGGLSKKSVNNTVSVFRTCLTTGYDWLSIQRTFPKVVWLKCVSQRTDHLSHDEGEALMRATSGTVHDLILMALHTGMRQAELRGLQWQSIDWQNNILTVRHTFCDQTNTLDTPKNNRERHIPLSNELRHALWARKQSAGHVFTRDGHPVRASIAAKWLTRACKDAGMRPIGWHTLRHTFASQLAARGVPLPAVQALMGHSTITMTMRYAHLAPSALREAINVLTGGATDPGRGQPVGIKLHAA